MVVAQPEVLNLDDGSIGEAAAPRIAADARRLA